MTQLVIILEFQVDAIKSLIKTTFNWCGFFFAKFEPIMHITI